MISMTSLPCMPRTAIVPAAGLGTRFLPATKRVPKELLPVVDTPGIELVAAEAAEAGAQRLVVVTSAGKDGVVAHFVEDLVLEGTLEARGKHMMLEKVRRAPALIKVESVVQSEPLGLGHAVLCAEPLLAPDEDAVAVLLPDDLVLPTGVLDTMAKVRARRGGSVLCAIEVTPDEISAYGAFDVAIVPDAANRMCSESTEWSRSRRPTPHRRCTRPQVVIFWIERSSTCCSAPTAGSAENSNSPTPSLR
jgi:UTP--glucose-1-phosphate uridylyltransferase